MLNSLCFVFKEITPTILSEPLQLLLKINKRTEIKLRHNVKRAPAHGFRLATAPRHAIPNGHEHELRPGRGDLLSSE